MIAVDGRPYLVIFLVMLGGVAACLQSPLVSCGELVCAPGFECTASGCASPADVAACHGLADGEECRASNGGIGTCTGGACRTGLCGNGLLDIGEACDDGNQVSGDGCRADCAKIEVCGDSEVDANEACDDGNHNPADGCDACVLTRWEPRVLVGGPVPGTAIGLAEPSAIASDGLGRLYVADTGGHRIRRIDLDGSIMTVAGTGTAGFSGDGGPATNAQLAAPSGIAVDGLGRIFLADTENQRIRWIDVDGTIRTIAGTGIAGYDGDGSGAIFRQLASPRGIAVDGFGSVFVADSENHRIRRIDVDGTIATIAGTGAAGFDGDGKAATTTELAIPFGVALDGVGRVVIADTGNHRIRRIELDGTMTTIAGTGIDGFGGDGGPATSAELSAPVAVAVAGTSLIIADAFNARIRAIASGGTITTLAGVGSTGFSGDGGAATAAELALPLGVASDDLGVIHVADASNHRIRRIDLAGTITTVAGTGGYGSGGDAGDASSAQLNDPFKVVPDAMGRLVIADTKNHRVRRVDSSGAITTIVGTGLFELSADGGPAAATALANPTGIAFDSSGRLLIVDSHAHRVRRIELDGTISTVAGKGTAGFSGDGGPATSAELDTPYGVAIDSLDRILIADNRNHRIRRVETDGTITTIAGTGFGGFSGDDGPATSAQLRFPVDVAIDSTGRIFIADTSNHRIRRIDLAGTITTVAGTGVSGFGGDGGPATSAQLATPNSIAIDALGRLLLTDTFNHRIRRVAVDGTITTIAGTGTRGANGDGAAAVAAELSQPNAVAVDALGRVLVTDAKNNRIRRIEADGVITTIAGKIDPEHVGPVTLARLANPRALAVASTFALSAGGTSGTLQILRGGRVDAVAGRYPQVSATANLARYRTESFGVVGGVAMDSTTGLIYVAETTSHRLHVITPVDPANPATWTIAALANVDGAAGFSGGAAATARFRAPTGLMLDEAARRLYIADTGNHAIRALDLPTGTVTTVVNTSGTLGFSGDQGPATSALLYRPSALARCPNGDLFVADSANHRIRRVAAATGEITTVLGDGIAASSGEGTPARTFPVDEPLGVACDPIGNLFITSTTAVRLLPASDDGVVDGDGAVQTIYAPPQTSFPGSMTRCLSGIAATSATTIELVDACSGMLVELERTPRP
jgi:cysteine-rich repeat protein